MTIIAVPTRYAGVQFRSRLEARWAAYFDINGFNWDYEPCELDGWFPDFMLETPFCQVYAEVKPIEVMPEDREKANWEPFGKALAHKHEVQVLLLGSAPAHLLGTMGYLCEPPEGALYAREHLNQAMKPDLRSLWRVAGSQVQWRPSK